MPPRVHRLLEEPRVAERARDAAPAGTPERAEAEAAVDAARQAYVDMVIVVAKDVGRSGMADLTETQLYMLEHRISKG